MIIVGRFIIGSFVNMIQSLLYIEVFGFWWNNGYWSS